MITVAVEIAIYVSIVVAYASSLAHQIDEEYRLGLRTCEGGDKIMIPIVGVAFYLAIIMLLANGLYFLVRFVWRRQRYFP